MTNLQNLHISFIQIRQMGINGLIKGSLGFQSDYLLEYHSSFIVHIFIDNSSSEFKKQLTC